mmetsp:Transcript_61551/g.177141  ORF Transcript_61551/g.177141 Transcript_61551/m.177141 type:complete len:384 (+) Transcript_61551:325-1476(+)
MSEELNDCHPASFSSSAAGGVSSPIRLSSSNAFGGAATELSWIWGGEGGVVAASSTGATPGFCPALAAGAAAPPSATASAATSEARSSSRPVGGATPPLPFAGESATLSWIWDGAGGVAAATRNCSLIAVGGAALPPAVAAGASAAASIALGGAQPARLGPFVVDSVGEPAALGAARSWILDGGGGVAATSVGAALNSAASLAAGAPLPSIVAAGACVATGAARFAASPLGSPPAIAAGAALPAAAPAGAGVTSGAARPAALALGSPTGGAALPSCMAASAGVATGAARSVASAPGSSLALAAGAARAAWTATEELNGGPSSNGAAPPVTFAGGPTASSLRLCSMGGPAATSPPELSTAIDARTSSPRRGRSSSIASSATCLG